MPHMIDFYFDFLSPYAYLAFQKLPALAAATGHGVQYHPVDLNWLKKQANNTGPSTREMPLKLKYARTDLQRWAHEYGVPLIPLVSYDSSRANKGVFYAQAREKAYGYISRLWHEVYGLGCNLGSDEVLSGVAVELGWDAGDFLRFTASPEADALLAASNLHAHEAGVFGVPTMIADGQMWWGNDRLGLMGARLAAVKA